MAVTLPETGTSIITPQELEFQLVHWNDDKGSLVITITTIFIVCAIIAVVLRLITRRVIIKIGWQLDDYAITLAMHQILALGLYVEALFSVHYGTGKHVLRVGVDGTVKIIAITFALELTYNICHLAIKTSLLFLYRSVLTLNNPRFKIAWYAIGAYVLAFTLASLLAVLLQCTPIHYGWDKLYGRMQGSCVDLKAEVVATSALNTMADVALLVLPIPLLWNLQMPLKQRLGLCVIFLLGIFACIASAIRIQYIAKVQGTNNFVDFTYIEVNTLIWSVVEPCVGIVCACLSALRPMLRVLNIGSLRARLSSGFKYGNSTRSASHSSEQVTSLTKKENPASPWDVQVQHEFSIDHSTVASHGLSNIEMRSMGCKSLDMERMT